MFVLGKRWRCYYVWKVIFFCPRMWISVAVHRVNTEVLPQRCRVPLRTLPVLCAPLAVRPVRPGPVSCVVRRASCLWWDSRSVSSLAEGHLRSMKTICGHARRQRGDHRSHREGISVPTLLRVCFPNMKITSDLVGVIWRNYKEISAHRCSKKYLSSECSIWRWVRFFFSDRPKMTRCQTFQKNLQEDDDRL